MQSLHVSLRGEYAAKGLLIWHLVHTIGSVRGVVLLLLSRQFHEQYLGLADGYAQNTEPHEVF